MSDALDATEAEGARPLVRDAGELGLLLGTMAMGMGCRPVPVSEAGGAWSSMGRDVSVFYQHESQKESWK